MPRPYHHRDLRQALIDAALAELERTAPEAVSLAALARSLGVSQAAPYRHFPDRDALLAAVAAEGFGAFRQALLAAAEQGAGPALTRLCRAYVEFGLERPGLYRLMFDSPVLGRPTPDGALLELALSSFAVLVEAVPEGEGRDERRRRALRIWVALHGVVLLAERKLLSGPSDLSLGAVVEDIAERG